MEKNAPSRKETFLRLSAAVFVTAVFQVFHGWDAAEFGLRLLVTLAVVMLAWRCRSLVPASVFAQGTSHPRQRFAVRILFWLALAVAVFVAVKLGQ